MLHFDAELERTHN